ncbi:glycosyltransferase family 2 protein [Halorussus salinus]|uniref:glycosyltransferase family 2 protein n=1 Tax=Halorussus salinus TaxID=1364935 RepID=UPI001EE4B220|nr:glycosyltransferase family 2 protein [Halorussus salinus]
MASKPNRSPDNAPPDRHPEPQVDYEEAAGVKKGIPLVGLDSETEPILSVVMPTLNEEEGVADCIQTIKETVARLGVTTEIIVSDSSTDRTPEIAESLGATVVYPDQEGYGYAYQYAFERARGSYIAMADADCTYDFGELPKLLEAIGEHDADIVMGSRLEGEIKSGAMPKLHQYIGNPLLTKFLNTFYGTEVSDAHSGFRVFRRDVLEELDLQSDGMEFASEMVMDAGANDLTIHEVPITYHERKGEATLESFRDGWRHIRFMLLNAPGYLFSIPGVLLTTLGVLVMGLAYTDISLGGWAIGIHSMIAGCVLTIAGYQIGSFGIYSTLTANPIQSSNNSLTAWVIDKLQLEHGLLLGGGLFLGGIAYVTYLVGTWLATGGAQLPLLKEDIIALSALILGLQTIFSAFFLSYLQNGT